MKHRRYRLVQKEEGSFWAMARAVGVYFYLTAYQTQPSGLASFPQSVPAQSGRGFCSEIMLSAGETSGNCSVANRGLGS